MVREEKKAAIQSSIKYKADMHIYVNRVEKSNDQIYSLHQVREF